MSICCLRKHPSTISVVWSAARRFISLVCVLALAGLVPVPSAHGAEADELYLKIFNGIEQADALAEKSKPVEARTKYIEAEKQLKAFKKNFPTYNTKVINYRLNYLAGKIDALSRPAPADISRPPAVAGPEIKLLDAGSEPRQVLRLQTKPQEVQRVKLSARMSMGLSVADKPAQTIKTPLAVMSATITPQETNAQGELVYEVAITDVTVKPEEGALPQLVQEMEKSLGKAKGMVLLGTMTDRYLTKQIEAKNSTGTLPVTKEDLETLKETFSNSELVLPEEAVGVGARWELKHKKKKRGMMVDETIQHEITALEGNVANIKSTIRQSATSQKISNPIMPALKVDMNKMTGSLTETATVDLTRIFPVHATADEQSEIIMSMTTGGQKQTLTMKSETQSTLETE